jgi:hypothetical protein
VGEQSALPERVQDDAEAVRRHGCCSQHDRPARDEDHERIPGIDHPTDRRPRELASLASLDEYDALAIDDGAGFRVCPIRPPRAGPSAGDLTRTGQACQSGQGEEDGRDDIAGDHGTEGNEAKAGSKREPGI